MKKIYIIIMMFLFSVSVAFGDEMDKNLPGASDQVKNSARQMIRAGIGSAETIDMTRLMLKNRFREQYVLQAHGAVIYAKKKMLPVEPIMNKAFEGMAKQVQDKNVVMAMEKVQARYAFAYEHAKQFRMENRAMNRIGDAIEECLAAGMNKNDIHAITRELRQLTQDKERIRLTEALTVEAFLAARDMSRLGVSSRTASDVVVQAVKNDYSPGDMKLMREQFMNDSNSIDPEYLANQYLTAIRRGVNAKKLGSSGISSSHTESSGRNETVTTRGGTGGSDDFGSQTRGQDGSGGGNRNKGGN